MKFEELFADINLSKYKQCKFWSDSDLWKFNDIIQKRTRVLIRTIAIQRGDNGCIDGWL
jgi:hypothetical protein